MADWFDEGRSTSPVDFRAMLDDDAVLDALAELVGLGSLLSISRTRDGGALGVTVTVDGRWRREYFRSAEELKGWLSEALPAVAEAAAVASRAPGSRTRRSRGL